MNMRWGNRNVALNWNYVFSPKLFANFNATFTQNFSRYNYSDNDSYGKKGEENTLRHSLHLARIQATNPGTTKHPGHH